MLQVYAHPSCTTCKRALKWLDAKQLAYTFHDIRLERPTKEILAQMIDTYGAKAVFNTSGEKYRELGLKDTLLSLSVAEQVALLVNDGMLLKRPVILDGTRMSIGAKEQVLEETWG